MRIAVCAPQVPFERGGAEIFADDLVGELRGRGHEADLVTIPYKWYPGERVLSQAFLWRLLDLSESDGRPIDLAIATKFPSYAVRHPNKVVWLLHQFRQAYDLDRAKRHDLLLDALAADSSLSCVIVGDGPDRERLEDVARKHGLDGRARFTGRIDEEELAALYARCLVVYYAPVDEDFGMVPYEAFLAEKPVVTTTDAGGPLEVVTDRLTGLVIEPHAAALAEACAWLRNHVDDARAWGQAGKEIARRVSWDETIARLLA